MYTMYITVIASTCNFHGNPIYMYMYSSLATPLPCNAHSSLPTQRLRAWESRERRKVKQYKFEREKEEERKQEMKNEAVSLGRFLADYDDEKEDSKYYRGGAYSRRKREREMEIERDERDRQREKEEMEALKLQVMERQIREREAGAGDRRKVLVRYRNLPAIFDCANTHTHTHTHTRIHVRAHTQNGLAGNGQDDDDSMVPMRADIDENIPLAKTDLAAAFPPIKASNNSNLLSCPFSFSVLNHGYTTVVVLYRSKLPPQ